MPSHKLTFDVFDKPSKNSLYKIYADLYDKKEDNRKVINIINQTGEGGEELPGTSGPQLFVSLSPKIQNFRYGF